MPEFNIQFPDAGRALGQAANINAARLRGQVFEGQLQDQRTARNQETDNQIIDFGSLQ